MTRYTVLGASGFIGSHLVEHLARMGADVSAPARDAAWPTRGLGHVVYCVGMTADYLERPLDTADAHVCRLVGLLREAEFDSLQYLSSTRLYDSGRPEAREANDLVLNPANPRHLFDLTKAAGEAICLRHGGARTHVLRLSSVYADSLDSDNYVHEIVRLAMENAEVALDTAPDYERDYIDVADVCDAVVAIAEGGRRPIYNVASGANVSNSELFKAVARATGCRISALRPASGTSSPTIDIGAIRDDFGISPCSILDNVGRIVAVQATRSFGSLRRAI